MILRRFRVFLFLRSAVRDLGKQPFFLTMALQMVLRFLKFIQLTALGYTPMMAFAEATFELKLRWV